MKLKLFLKSFYFVIIFTWVCKNTFFPIWEFFLKIKYNFISQNKNTHHIFFYYSFHINVSFLKKKIWFYFPLTKITINFFFFNISHIKVVFSWRKKKVRIIFFNGQLFYFFWHKYYIYVKKIKKSCTKGRQHFKTIIYIYLCI